MSSRDYKHRRGAPLCAPADTNEDQLFYYMCLHTSGGHGSPPLRVCLHAHMHRAGMKYNIYIKRVGEHPCVLPRIQTKINYFIICVCMHRADIGVRPYGYGIQYTLNRIIWYILHASGGHEIQYIH